ncbi:MAG: hypothetical protein K2P78_06915, partial [Gemmataceae bacterium]|nr:hypothetical protein [Gemmataceae bacterium]
LVAAPAAPAGGRPLVVSPAAAPRPALTYRLLPDVRELRPGNPVQWYVRSFAEQRNFFFRRESIAARAKYRAMPLDELRKERIDGYGGNALKQTDWGARLDTPDWGVLERVKAEGIELTFPELDPLWVLATALQVRFRVEVADGRVDDAIRTAKTMFALARHLGEYPAAAGNRLGIATAGLALDTLAELVQQPGCPNLYWALTDLPVPLVDVRKGVQGDRAIADTELKDIRGDEAMTEAELDAVIGRLSGRVAFLREQAGRPPRGLRTRLAELTKEAGRAAAARHRVMSSASAAGLKEKAAALRVLSFPDAQVILLDERRAFAERCDDDAKWLGVPAWQGEPGRTRDGLLFADLLPPVGETRLAQARLEQRVALLRHVEAVRLHAAGHGGKLPVNLADVGVPLPADPFTGRPVEYATSGDTARLRGAAPKGEPAGPAVEIVIRK